MRALGAILTVLALLCACSACGESTAPRTGGGGRGVSPGPGPARDAQMAAPLDGGIEAFADAGPPELDVPASEACAPASVWDGELRQLESRVFRLINEARARPQDCGTRGKLATTTPLMMEAHLRCAARLHSLYMASAVDDFEHATRDGTSPSSRAIAAGYELVALGENLGVGEIEPEQIVKYWLESDGHCAVLMHPDFVDVGVGLARGRWDSESELGVIDAPYWTLDFGVPAPTPDTPAPDGGP